MENEGKCLDENILFFKLKISDSAVFERCGRQAAQQLQEGDCTRQLHVKLVPGQVWQAATIAVLVQLGEQVVSGDGGAGLADGLKIEEAGDNIATSAQRSTIWLFWK